MNTKSAMILANLLHGGQYDKAGALYIHHCMAVASKVHPDYFIPAVLHDTIEDTIATPGYLLDQGVDVCDVDLIVTLSRRPNEDYWDYIVRVGHDHAASTIKIADLTHNLDMSRFATSTMNGIPSPSLINRYIKALAYLKTK
jgi:(p)ppGpp synthase/HD superfamily hydrolase